LDDDKDGKISPDNIDLAKLPPIVLESIQEILF
jgi:hypothetical protein